MPHDTIDNRSDKLLDDILTTLPGTERARFAVGYLFLSGLKPLREQLERLTDSHKLSSRTRFGLTMSQTLRQRGGI